MESRYHPLNAVVVRKTRPRWKVGKKIFQALISIKSTLLHIKKSTISFLILKNKIDSVSTVEPRKITLIPRKKNWKIFPVKSRNIKEICQKNVKYLKYFPWKRSLRVLRNETKIVLSSKPLVFENPINLKTRSFF